MCIDVCIDRTVRELKEELAAVAASWRQLMHRSAEIGPALVHSMVVRVFRQLRLPFLVFESIGENQHFPLALGVLRRFRQAAEHVRRHPFSDDDRVCHSQRPWRLRLKSACHDREPCTELEERPAPRAASPQLKRVRALIRFRL
jgi:hypothetical protein